jgi:hypothetical protein
MASPQPHTHGTSTGREADEGRTGGAERPCNAPTRYTAVHMRPAARSEEPKHELLARLKATNTRRALFFCACVGMSLANNISARKISRREVGPSCSATASGSPAARAGDTGAPPTPTLDFFRAISAGGVGGDQGVLLLVSTVALCGAKPNSLTPLGPVVLPLLKITM